MPLCLAATRASGPAAVPDITLLRNGRRRRRRPLRALGRRTLHPAHFALLTHLGAARLHGGAALFDAQHPVVIRVNAGEAFRRLAFNFGDDDGEAVGAAARGVAPHAPLLHAAPRMAPAAGGHPAFAARLLARRLELG